MVDMTVVVPPSPPQAPAATKATACAIPATDSMTVVLCRLIYLRVPRWWRVCLLRLHCRRRSLNCEGVCLSPSLIILWGVLPALGDGREGLPPFILEGAEGEEMEAEEWNLVEVVADRADMSLDAIVRILGNFGGGGRDRLLVGDTGVDSS